MDLIGDPKKFGIDPTAIANIQQNVLETSANLVAISSNLRYITDVLRKLAAQLDRAAPSSSPSP